MKPWVFTLDIAIGYLEVCFAEEPRLVAILLIFDSIQTCYWYCVRRVERSGRTLPWLSEFELRLRLYVASSSAIKARVSSTFKVSRLTLA